MGEKKKVTTAQTEILKKYIHPEYLKWFRKSQIHRLNDGWGKEELIRFVAENFTRHHAEKILSTDGIIYAKKLFPPIMKPHEFALMNNEARIAHQECFPRNEVEEEMSHQHKCLGKREQALKQQVELAIDCYRHYLRTRCPYKPNRFICKEEYSLARMEYLIQKYVNVSRCTIFFFFSPQELFADFVGFGMLPKKYTDEDFVRMLGKYKFSMTEAGNKLVVELTKVSQEKSKWVKRLKIKNAKWEDITITALETGLLISHEDSPKTIVELWENINLGNKKRERTLLENLQKASNISKKDVKYKSKDVVSRPRKILREASGIPSEATRDPKPILWKNGKATRIFQMGKSDTVISNEPELKDEDSIEFISKFDKKELHPEKGSFHID